MELRVESSARGMIFQKSVQAKGIPVWNMAVFQDGLRTAAFHSFAHNRNPPRIAFSLRPMRAPGGNFLSFFAFPPPSTT
jgi:hypothetical protein